MKQRGFGLVAQLIAGAVVASLAAGAFAYYNHVVAERARLELDLSEAVTENSQQAQVVADLRADIKKRDAIAAAREELRKAQNIERDLLNAEIAELRKQPDVAAWMDSRVPGPLLERLRRRPAAADKGPDGKAVPAQPVRGGDR